MRRVSIVAIVLCLLAASTAQAQFFGQLGPLNPKAASGLEMAGAYLGLASSTWGFTGQMRFGLDPKMDVGVQAGFSHVTGASSGGARVDLKADLADMGKGSSPIALGGDADLHFASGGGATVFGFTAVPGASISSEVGSGQTLAGWAGFGLQVEFPSEGDTFSTALLRLGAEFGFTPEVGVVGEFNHLFAGGGSDEFMFGLSYSLGGSSGGKRH